MSPENSPEKKQTRGPSRGMARHIRNTKAEERRRIIPLTPDQLLQQERQDRLRQIQKELEDPSKKATVYREILVQNEARRSDPSVQATQRAELLLTDAYIRDELSKLNDSSVESGFDLNEALNKLFTDFDNDLEIRNYLTERVKTSYDNPQYRNERSMQRSRKIMLDVKLGILLANYLESTE